MKNKIKVCTFLIGIAVLLTGCLGDGTEKLVCSQKEENDGVTTEAIVTLKSKDDKLTIVTGSTEMTLETEEDAEAAYDELKQNADDMKNENGITAKTTRNKNTVKLTLEFNLSKMKKEDIKTNFDTEDEKVSASEFRKTLEKDGYTCK